LNKLEKNWKKWKEDRQIDESKHLKGVEEKMEEENRTFLQRRNLKRGVMSRSLMVDFILFSLFTLFYFTFTFTFSFSIFRTNLG